MGNSIGECKEGNRIKVLTGEGQGEVLAELRLLSFSSGSSTELIRTFLVLRRALLLWTGLEGAEMKVK